MEQDERIWREPKVQDITGLSRSTRWRMIKEGKFPAPVPLSRSAVGWLRSEVLKWIEQCARSRERLHE